MLMAMFVEGQTESSTYNETGDGKGGNEGVFMGIIMFCNSLKETDTIHARVKDGRGECI